MTVEVGPIGVVKPSRWSAESPISPKLSKTTFPSWYNLSPEACREDTDWLCAKLVMTIIFAPLCCAKLANSMGTEFLPEFEEMINTWRRQGRGTNQIVVSKVGG